MTMLIKNRRTQELKVFFTLKKELIYQETYDTKFHAERDIFEFIAVYYNSERQNSELIYLSPDAFEKKNLTD